VSKKKIKIRKPKSGKGWRDWFSWAKRSQTRSSRVEEKEKFSRRLKIAAMSIFLPLLPAGLVVGFFYMEKYVDAQQQAAPPTGPLVFVRGQTETVVPESNYKLNKETAKTIAQELSSKTWMYNIQVRTTNTKVLVYADYRIPAAWIKGTNGKTLYVGLPAKNDPLGGSENTVVVSDYTVDTPPTIEIVGYANKTSPTVGQAWHAPDVAAALELLSKLKGMDDKVCPKKPLRAEIASIDITNYEGRKAGPTSSHIILKLKDGTPVYWGAALGKAASFFEAPDGEKLNRLYTFYQQNKYTLLGQAKTIELFQPMSGVPRPQ
jgi:hypothetical protein